MKHLSALDGWRGLAISCVIFYHLLRWHYNCPGVSEVGIIGVELFFVLSGFLITKNLISVFLCKNPSRGLGAFYIRRMFRIFPALLVFLGSLALVLSLGISRALKPISWIEWSSCIFLWRNYYHGHGVTDHLWSLSVEEHTYLLLGLVFFCMRNRLSAISMLIFLTGAVGFFYKFSLGKISLSLSAHSEIRMFSPLCGALLAFFLEQNICRKKLSSINPWFPFLIGIILWLSLPLPFGIFMGTPLFAVALGTLVLQHEKNSLATILDFPLLRYLGTISFSLYLWQQPFLMNIKLGDEMPLYARLLVSCVALTAALFLASLSYFFVEKPIREWGRYLAKLVEKKDANLADAIKKTSVEVIPS